MMSIRHMTTIALAGASMAVTIGLAGCVPQPGEADDAPFVESVEADADIDETVVGGDDEATDGKSDKEEVQMSQDMETVSDIKEVGAYAVKVGYHSEAGYDVAVISSEDEWNEYIRGMGTTYYDGDGNATVMVGDGFKGYSKAFFDAGNTLAVVYEDLGSGSYSPSVTGVEVDGAVARVACDYGIPSGMMVTTDMSGFVTVVEVPAGMSVTGIEKV